MKLHYLIQHLKQSTDLDRDCVKLIEQCHKFVFNPGEVPEEILDGAVQFSRELMANEIFPMPFDFCLFELGPTGIRTGEAAKSLLCGDDWEWIVAWREVDPLTKRWAIYFRAFTRFGKLSVISNPGVGQIFTEDYHGEGEHGYFRLLGLDKQNAKNYDFKANLANRDANFKKQLEREHQRLGVPIDALHETLKQSSPDDYAEFTNRMLDIAFHHLLSVLGLMSTSAGISIESVKPTKKFINALRARKGKPPLEYEHKLVRIDPALTKLPGVVALGGTHASPRLHWRRGHIRTLKDGRKTQVKPCIVGDVSKGLINHDYVISGKLRTDRL